MVIYYGWELFGFFNVGFYIFKIGWCCSLYFEVVYIVVNFISGGLVLLLKLLYKVWVINL